MKRVAVVLVVLGLGAAAPADARHAWLSAERAAKRARITAAALADRSSVVTYARVRTASCRRVGTTGHRRDCRAELFAGAALVCTTRIRVRFRDPSGYGTVTYAVDRLRC